MGSRQELRLRDELSGGSGVVGKIVPKRSPFATVLPKGTRKSRSRERRKGDFVTLSASFASRGGTRERSETDYGPLVESFVTESVHFGTLPRSAVAKRRGFATVWPGGGRAEDGGRRIEGTMRRRKRRS